MDAQEQLDRSIGTPGLRVDVERVLATGRAQQRRRRALAGSAAVAVVAATATGAWAVQNRDSDLKAAERETVTLSTCTRAQLAEVNPTEDSDQIPVLVTGASAVCVAPTAQVVEQIDQPITGKKSIALRLGGLATGEADRTFNVVVVWGAYGVDDTWAVPVMDIDWDVVVTGLQSAGAEEFPERPLADFVAALNVDGLPASAGRAEGWTHCSPDRMGKEALVAEVDGVTCVATGYEVLDRADGSTLLDEFLASYGAGLSPSERRDARDQAGEVASMTGWELVGRDGRMHYLMLGGQGRLNAPQVMPMRVPMALVFGLFASQDTVVSSESGVGSDEGAADSGSGASADGATATESSTAEPADRGATG